MIRIHINLKEISEKQVTISWNDPIQPKKKNVSYKVYWSDRYTKNMVYKCVKETTKPEYTLHKSTHIPHYLKVEVLQEGRKIGESSLLKTPIKRILKEQIEMLNRGLIVIKTKEGIFLSWRMLIQEVSGYTDIGMSGTDYIIYKNGTHLAVVKDSTNYLDREGKAEDAYAVAALSEGGEKECSKAIKALNNQGNYIELPLQIPNGGCTPAGEAYTYHANDMSIGDVDGDGEYEYFVKWDPSNSKDVSIKGYTGKCYIDCYKLSGRLLWRLDLGRNIRAGAHYTQFMVYDFDGDGRAEMSVKTAAGTKMTIYEEDGNIQKEFYITLPLEHVKAGVSHQDNYVCSKKDYYKHVVEMFQNWHTYKEVISKQWPATLEECFGISQRFSYPLTKADAKILADYFFDEYAPARSEKNQLRMFEGFIYKGFEYLTMFGGDGMELETIPFPHPREDDGLRWGDYAMPRIEPCNRVDRFLSGVAYLDGERPYLIIGRGYYTKTTIVAYEFFHGKHQVVFNIDSGHVPMQNPFCDHPHEGYGNHPVYGVLAGQGNHSLATADVDGDGYQEIIYGAAVIDHDGSILYSLEDKLPDGTNAKLGHGDAMHVAVIDPDRPSYQIFSVFEGGKAAPYGFALRDAESGEILFGKYAKTDLGRCMIGNVNKEVRGLSIWVNEMYDCKGNVLSDKVLGTNQSIRWAGDLTTQIMDGSNYLNDKQIGIINDNIHGVMLQPKGTMTNNGTKGNPCLIADVFGDFREELLLRTEDSSAIRIYINTEITHHKLFTLMHDVMYRTGIAWQNNCYNQPCYTKFYYASDMDFSNVLPYLMKDMEEEGSPTML